MIELAHVSIAGVSVMAVLHEGTVVVPMKHFCESCGLEWHAQFDRIRRSLRLAKGTIYSTVPTPGGPQQMLCLPVRQAYNWLITVNLRRIQDERVRSQVMAMQEQMLSALDDRATLSLFHSMEEAQ